MDFSVDPRSALARSDVDEARLLARLRAGDERAYAEDALQETFVAAFKSPATFQGEAQFGTWLHRIAVNAALMKRSVARRRGEHDGEPPRELVRANVDRLPENLRIALVPRDIEELDNAEVATRLDLTVNAAKIRIHRARQALRELLDSYFGLEDA